MKLAQWTTRKKWIITLGCLLVLAAAIGWFEIRHPTLEQRIYRIGFDDDPPQHYIGKDGKLTGLVVEVIDEAARRRGIRLQWVPEPESSESALKARKVDLWPVMTIRPERKGVVYITEPYRQDEICFIVRSGSAATRLEDLRKSTIAYDGEPLDARVLHLHLPNAQLSLIESPRARLEAVCKQRVEAAYFDEYAALAALLDGIACGEQGLRVIQVPEMNGLLGVGAVFEARPAADAIREAIGDMAADGTLDRIASRWRFFSSKNLEVASELARVQSRERWLLVGIFGTVFLLLMTWWQAIRTQRALASAKEATALKNRFLANMSHEIRTPMNAILGMTALAMDTPDHEERTEYLKDVMSAGESLLSLLNDILDFSKIEAGKLTFEHVDFAPADVVCGVCALLVKGARDKGLDLVCHLGEPLPSHVQGDPARLRQALVNLVGNAIKFTKTGGVDLEAVVVSDSEHAVSVRFAVKDTGIGISKEAQRRIFESFAQADGSVARRYGGTGLGLSISRELISRMGGELRVESALGRGSTFWFVLPFEKAHAMGSGSGESRFPKESEQLV